MLPVYTIIFFGVMYVKDVVMVAHEALTQARECAWAYSKKGCKGMPEGCMERPRGARTQNTPDELFTSLTREPVDETQGPNHFDETRQQMKEEMDKKAQGSGGLVGKLKQAVMDIVMEVAEAFGNKKADLYASNTVEPPTLVGSTRVVGISYRLACNTVPKTIIDVFKDLFEPINPF
jgi:hypothetical protein